MTLTFELDLDDVRLNQISRPEVISFRHTDTDTQTGPIALVGLLHVNAMWSITTTRTMTCTFIGLI